MYVLNLWEVKHAKITFFWGGHWTLWPAYESVWVRPCSGVCVCVCVCVHCRVLPRLAVPCLAHESHRVGAQEPRSRKTETATCSWQLCLALPLASTFRLVITLAAILPRRVAMSVRLKLDTLVLKLDEFVPASYSGSYIASYTLISNSGSCNIYIYICLC